MASPLLSIVIPTRDRPDTALLCIRQVLAIPDRDIQIVVRDCGKSDTLQDGLRHFDDPRLIYERGAACSMNDNWNAAYALTTGDYISFIGDDDGFLPSAVGVVRALAERHVDAISYAPHATYFWPDFPVQSRAGHLFYMPTSIGEIPIISSRESLFEYFRIGQERRRPMLYHGVTSRAILSRAQVKVGPLFQSMAPDTFLSAVLCSLDAQIAVLNAPLIINGKSGNSNSGIYLGKTQRARHSGEFSPRERQLNALVPPIDSIPTLVADSYVKGLIAAGDDTLVAMFARHYLGTIYVEAALRHPERALSVLRYYAKQLQSGDPRIRNLGFVRGALWQLGTLAISRLRKLLARGGHVHDPLSRVIAASDIYEAVEALERTKAELEL